MRVREEQLVLLEAQGRRTQAGLFPIFFDPRCPAVQESSLKIQFKRVFPPLKEGF
jgi:hypothetical protein